MRSSILILVVLGCGTTSNVDAGTDARADAVLDAPSLECDLTKPFRAPVVLGVPMPLGDGPPSLSQDELTLYFHRLRSGSLPEDIFVATRTDRTSGFGTPSPLANVNVNGGDGNPMVTSNDLVLFLERGTMTSSTIFVSTRASRDVDFSNPIALPGSVNTGVEGDAFLQDDGEALWLAAYRMSGLGDFDIYRAPKAGNGFGDAVLVTELSSVGRDSDPTLSKDGLTIFFSRMNKTTNDIDIWSATRPSTTAAFSGAARVDELSSATDDAPGWLSPDGCRIYIVSGKPSMISVAERPRKAN